ncbi:MAG: S8 family serine peptidase, partial [Proteobacteria bacterium]|nr:S8 family serine peptidase [Pseudomonadota bacterium]
GHGTFVAGIIGARRNSAATHGVAFQSTILALRADTAGSCAVACSFSTTDVATAIDFAVANGARVINLSLGGGASADINTALANAAAAGVIFVAAAGNAGDPDPIFPAQFARDAGALGLGIAAGASNTGNTIAGFSNRAGNTATAYLVAPGVDVVSTNLGGGTAAVSGTSFAAPHIAGAIAVLLQRFPGLTAAQVVDLLFTTATDLGAAGTDAVYGRGLLNLEEAFRSQGVLNLPLGQTVNGDSESLEGTLVALGPAFGDALQNESFLANAIILDAYQRAYVVDLRERVLTARPQSLVARFIGATQSGSPKSRTIPLLTHNGLALGGLAPSSLSITLGLAPSQDRFATGAAALEGRSGAAGEPREDIESAYLSADIAPGARMALGINATSSAIFGDFADPTLRRAPFADMARAATPQLTLVGRGNGGTVAYEPDDRTRLSFGAMAAERGVLGSKAGASRIAQAQITHRRPSGPLFGLGVSSVREERALFLTGTSGAFRGLEGTSSGFLTAFASAPLVGRISAFASYTEGRASVDQAGGRLLSNWSGVRANAFAVGAVMRGVANPGDRFGLMVSQPLRVYRAQADLTLPVSRDADGNVRHQTRRVDVVPSGRETRLQVAYGVDLGSQDLGSLGLGRGASVDGFAAVTFEPGHNSASPASFGTGVRLRLAF